MEDLWYQNPSVLGENLDQFFPNKNFNRIQKINSIARFAIYYSILLIGFGQDTKWLSVSVVMLIISYCLGVSEQFTPTDIKLNTGNCEKPTRENPFMNYTVGDLITNSNRLAACKYDDVKMEIRQKFKSQLIADTNDIWGKHITDRNYYTMPNTSIVNDQTGFALWCFGNSGQCKTTGQNCLKQRDPTYHRGRMTTIPDDTELIT
jgi:hypothetical protein